MTALDLAPRPCEPPTRAASPADVPAGDGRGPGVMPPPRGATSGATIPGSGRAPLRRSNDVDPVTRGGGPLSRRGPGRGNRALATSCAAASPSGTVPRMDDTTVRTRRLDVACVSRGLDLSTVARLVGPAPSALSRLRAGRPAGRVSWPALARALDLPDDALDPSPEWSALLPTADPPDAHAARALRFAVAVAARGMAARDVAPVLGLRSTAGLRMLVRHGVEVGRTTWRGVEAALGLAPGALEPGAPFVELIPAELRAADGGTTPGGA